MIAVFDTRGSLSMMSEEDYHRLIHVRSVRGKRICLICSMEDCKCVSTRTRYHHGGDSLSYTHRQAQEKASFDALLKADWGRLVDEFARWYEGELYEDYYGEF